jgi:hypothetical protein
VNFTAAILLISELDADKNPETCFSHTIMDKKISRVRKGVFMPQKWIIIQHRFVHAAVMRL